MRSSGPEINLSADRRAPNALAGPTTRRAHCGARQVQSGCLSQVSILLQWRRAQNNGSPPSSVSIKRTGRGWPCARPDRATWAALGSPPGAPDDKTAHWRVGKQMDERPGASVGALQVCA